MSHSYSFTDKYSSSINKLVALLGGVSCTVNLYFSTWVSKSPFWIMRKEEEKKEGEEEDVQEK